MGNVSNSGIDSEMMLW